MKNELSSFVKSVEEAGGHPAGPIVYSLNNVPNNEIMDIEFLLI